MSVRHRTQYFPEGGAGMGGTPPMPGPTRYAAGTLGPGAGAVTEARGPANPPVVPGGGVVGRIATVAEPSVWGKV